MALFGSDKTQLRLAQALERLVALYELDLQSRGITTLTGAEEGEVFETDEDFLFEQERLEHVRAALGLPREYPVGSALPTPGVLRDLPREKEEENLRELASGSSLEAFSGSSWGIGPEGAEGFGEGTEGKGNS
jgi:hypothetical protein